MSDRLMVTGIVLQAFPIGECDKRLVLLTKERGKITVFARGARRTASPLLAAANSFVFGKFFLVEGRTSYRLTGAEVQNYFREIAFDMEAACYGSYFLEFADYYTRENNDELEMLRLVYAALRAILNKNLDNRLVRCVYELKAMVINGEYPQVFSCPLCGKEEELCSYFPEKNGIVCRDCAESNPDCIRLEPSAVYTLQYVISAPAGKLFAFAVSDEVLKEFAGLMAYLRKRYIGHTFKSEEILNSIVNYWLKM